VALLSAAIQGALTLGLGEVNLHPPFMHFEPLAPGRYWILAAWLPFWLLNILGEEFLWRGVLLPRQEAALGQRAWLANAAGWGLFHLAFGWQLLTLLLPILVIVPYIAQCPGTPTFTHSGDTQIYAPVPQFLFFSPPFPWGEPSDRWASRPSSSRSR
jgi:membrane protease YdiL (CAAX protease family)